MNTIFQIQESKFTDYYCDNVLKQLNHLKEINNNIQIAYKDLYTHINEEIFKSDIHSFFNGEIDKYIKWVETNNNKDYKSKENYNNKIKEAFDEYIETYKNDYFKKINKSFEELNNIMDEIIDYSFDPPKINNSSDELVNLKLFDTNGIWVNLGQENSFETDYLTISENFYNKSINSEDKNDYNSFECNNCKDKKAIFYCTHCNNYYCEECFSAYKNHDQVINHIFINMDDKKKENEQLKNTFLESFINMFRNCIYKCNYILKNENQNYVDPNTYKVYQYPLIKNENNFDDQLNFLMDLNNNYELIKNKIDIHKSINEKKICDKLLTSLENMFGEKKFKFKTDLEDIEDDFYSDE